MRTGFATSACAAAAATAALRALLSGEDVSEIRIDLPTLKEVAFQLARCERQEQQVCCGVVKDAGDDPDVTNGIEIQAVVRRSPVSGIHLQGGVGIGRVTLPGLPVSVGEAAINPGPRKLIMQILQAELNRLQVDSQAGFEVIIQAPDGERVAAATMNPKLGIIGGISILGTDGLVRPYSAPAFRASLFYELRVAKENGYSSVGLATGKRSTAYLRDALKDQSDLGVLDVGDELGYPIDQALRMGFRSINIGGMIGKLSKLAQGRFQTHVQEGEIDFEFLAKLAAHLNAPAELCEQIRNARTAHQVQNWLRAEQLSIEPVVARLAAEQVYHHCGSRVGVAVWLFALNGALLGQASLEEKHG